MAIKEPIHVVIIGGVAGGMSSATRLRRLDEHCRITVIERDPYISSATCGLPYALSGVIDDEAKLHVQTKEKIKAWFNIDVLTKTEAVAIDRSRKIVTTQNVDERGRLLEGSKQSLSYDKLIIATGAEATVPPIEGIDSDHVFTLRTILDLEKIKAYRSTHHVQHVAVIGGGFIGLEAAENLVKLGLDVTIFDSMSHVMPPIDADIAETLHAELRRNGVKLILNARIVKVDRGTPSESGLVYLQSGERITADAIILSAGIHGRTELAERAGLAVSGSGIKIKNTLQTTDPDIYAVGDVIPTPNIVSGVMRNIALAGPANRQGRLAADHICGRKVLYKGHTGSFVCQVFDLTVASVGLTVTELARSGKKFEYVTVHPADHAGYYPGACPITLKVTFDPIIGKLLGAQGVGKKAVDKRIDVLATAIRAGMTVRDLQDLELAYAPPYGSAKDPVNMAGFVGTNVLDGDVMILHSADILALSKRLEPAADGQLWNISDYQILDVRTTAEYDRGHLKGAVNIPIADLRQHCDKLNPEKPTLVYCQVGYRGYLAYRILKQNGFPTVFNLDGGYKSASEGGYKDLTTVKGQ